jgi:hypothetical protein
MVLVSRDVYQIKQRFFRASRNLMFVKRQLLVRMRLALSGPAQLLNREAEGSKIRWI